MTKSGLAIAAILVSSCAATDGPSPPPAFPHALSQYAPLNASSVSTFGENPLESEVHSQLLALPYFGVFDHLAFTVDGGTVFLHGQVFHPELWDEAEYFVSLIPGVHRVVNLITMLPDSPADNRIRVAVFTAIYGDRSMRIYTTVGGGGAIHIVVQGGRVSLEGEVGSSADARKAALLACAQAKVVSVTNHLVIASH
jgi:hyperosmotically inducible protein